MKTLYGFNQTGNWYKGNLHCHSTNSDGMLDPQEVAAYYKDAGWNFLALTEHNRYTNHQKYNDENFILLPGIEVDVHNPDPYRIYHVVGIQGKDEAFIDAERSETIKWNGIDAAQELIDRLAQKGHLPIFCHPKWSRLELTDFLELDGYFAMEIYNHGCEVENHTGLAVDYWDSLLRRGRKVWGVATDDAHHRMNDRCGGWLMVKAEELTPVSIAGALRAGSFYASNGPKIHAYRIQDGEAFVECSPVKSINFVAYENWGRSFHANGEGHIESASHKLTGNEKYVRVECIDQYGHTAWSNPIFL